ncbi:uncharacterized protein LAESUDRAFT_796156 [Laetiporus sulphureus 93-53]|uniref:Phosphatidate phosphatase APP1 catalytic domain-containing protein n=1 Tax=Laetiporus sulphureus 93-53 TaxID=1314785 RepID=A0A165G4Y9_9APHY|nr:uncharacterized protein LAESUDRAFT_796156 [Laetiporus sulphureus 93-53]KZT09836.1 hypothetical protein LAESUDRAFT_796156 [Laetiporus sulphureus 93-53]
MPSSWRSLASAASRQIKTYVSQKEFRRASPSSRGIIGDEGSSRKQSWTQWAGQKLRQVQGENTGVEQVLLFPGWAARRFHEPSNSVMEVDRICWILTAREFTDAPFEIEVYISGYASRASGPGFNTRSGRAFLKVATSFAAIPKLAMQASQGNGQSGWTQNTPLSKSTEDLLANIQLPVKPEETDENAEAEALEKQLHDLRLDPSSTTETESLASSSGTSSMDSESPSSPAISMTGPGAHFGALSPLIQRWNRNLETRLHPFWNCTSLSARTVRVSLYATDPSLYQPEDQRTSGDYITHQPLMRRDVVTGPDGSFQMKFHVSWETLCLHPEGVHVAFGDRRLEQDLFVVAELMALPPRPPPNTTPYQPPPQYSPSPSASSSIPVPLTSSRVRVISDIDDTVKLASVLSGARAVFQTVFVKDLDQSIIPGMADWYMKMWRRGVRFHYVSNGPFELLPIINQFFQLSHLPPGSIKLRSYGGRSLFTGLLSAPAARKRAAVVEVLDNFPDGQFITVGDSGEQDLELYADIARERPRQIIAIFIRDVMVDSDLPPLDDPTGTKALVRKVQRQNTSSSASLMPVRSTARKNSLSRPMTRSVSEQQSVSAPRTPKRTHSYSEVPLDDHEASLRLFNSTSMAASPINEEPEDFYPESLPPLANEQQFGEFDSDPRPYLTEAERRREELQRRVWIARGAVPAHISLRVFRHPQECVEAMSILDGLQVG